MKEPFSDTSGVFILFDNHTHTPDATFLLYLLHVCSGIIDYDIWSGIINFEIIHPSKMLLRHSRNRSCAGPNHTATA